jgi:L-malate glycosyltransferase
MLIDTAEFSVLESCLPMKHILYVLPYMNLGGTEKQAFSLMNNLQQHYQISLLAPDGLGANPFRQAGFDYYEFPRLEKNLIGGLRQFRQALLKIHNQRSIDLIHIHAAHELTLLAKLILPGIPIIFTVHGYHGRQSGLGYFLAAIFGNLFAQQVITVSQSERQILADDRLQSRKTTLIYNGVAEPLIDLQRAHHLATKFACDQPEQITIGTAARLSEAKGLEYLIVAISQLVARHPNIKLIIAGDGELKESLLQMVDNLGISDYVVFAGYIQDVHNLMYSFDIFVLPSLQEALPLACAEAMSMSKPVVATAVGGLPEQVIDGKTGFIVPPKDPQALATSIDKLISNPALLADFGQQGYQHYLQNFALPTMLHDTVDVYEKVMSQTN